MEKPHLQELFIGEGHDPLEDDHAGSIYRFLVCGREGRITEFVTLQRNMLLDVSEVSFMFK